MARTNDDVAALLSELSTLTEIEEGSPQAFRVRAYDDAVRAIRGLSRDVAGMSAEELMDIRGIGGSIAAKVREFVDTGTIDKLERLRAAHPSGQLDLMRVPGIGAKTVRLLADELGVEDLEGLRGALRSGAVAELPGMGTKTQDNIRRALDRLSLTTHEHRAPVAEALPLAERVVDDLAGVAGVQEVVYAGSLRRFRNTIGDVDVLVTTDEPGAVADAFTGLPVVSEVIARGDTKTSVVATGGVQIDLRVVAPGHLGAALVYFTGSRAHNIRLRERALARGLTLNEYALADEEDGRVVASTTEEEVYTALDLPLIPPELREDDGEVELADEGALPGLVADGDLRGDVHLHSDWSGDGTASLEVMLGAVRDRGLDYVALTDHAEDLSINGLSRDEMLAQRERLAELRDRFADLTILHGAELNIGVDGGLDYDPEFLAAFDWCTASVHSHFTRPVGEQTERVVAAVRNPAVAAIGHLTGRRIGRRPGIELDVDRVLDAAVETGTAIEINGNLDRLDAPVPILREGAARGATFVIASDAHAPRELRHLEFGVRQARRAGLPPERVATTWEPDRFLAWVRRVRGG